MLPELAHRRYFDVRSKPPCKFGPKVSFCHGADIIRPNYVCFEGKALRTSKVGPMRQVALT
jgi:hypothetical protein